MISRDQVSEALHFISETDRKFAEAKTEVERASWACKRIRAVMYAAVDGKNVEERKSAVDSSAEVQKAEERRFNSILAFEGLKAERETKFLIVDVWRSVEATRRRETIQ